MRQRRVKNEKDKVLAFEEYLELNPKDRKGTWNHKFGNNNKINVEIGCGRGQFITLLAEKNKGDNYVAIEPQGSIILRALEKAEDKEQKNVIFIWDYANNIEEFFEENEIDGIYLNFSDPWPKIKHAKRRITHENFLTQYAKILKDDGILRIKTDNKDLFDFTLEEIEKSKFEILEKTFDLHNSEHVSDNIMTEYEERFVGLQKKINYCKLVLKK